MLLISLSPPACPRRGSPGSGHATVEVTGVKRRVTFGGAATEPARLTLTGPSNTTAGRGSSSASSAGSVARPPSDRAPLLLAARNQTGAASNEDQTVAKRNSMGIVTRLQDAEAEKREALGLAVDQLVSRELREAS